MTLQQVQRTTHQSTRVFELEPGLNSMAPSLLTRARTKAKEEFACDFVVSNSYVCAVPADTSCSHLRPSITRSIILYLSARMIERDWSSAAPFFIRVGFLDGSGLKRIRARRIIGNESHQGRSWPAHHFTFFFLVPEFLQCVRFSYSYRGWRPEPPQAVHIAEGQLCNFARRK